MNDMRIGDQVLDADGRHWTALNAPCRIPGAESEGLFREECPVDAATWNGGRQRYGQHMRHPLVVWSAA